jgi:hypothetical protein
MTFVLKNETINNNDNNSTNDSLNNSMQYLVATSSIETRELTSQSIVPIVCSICHLIFFSVSASSSNIIGRIYYLFFHFRIIKFGSFSIVKPWVPINQH